MLSCLFQFIQLAALRQNNIPVTKKNCKKAKCSAVTKNTLFSQYI